MKKNTQHDNKQWEKLKKEENEGKKIKRKKDKKKISEKSNSFNENRE